MRGEFVADIEPNLSRFRLEDLNRERCGDSGEAERSAFRDDPERHRSVATLASRLCAKVFGFVKEKLSGAQRRKDAASGQRGAGKGGRPCPASAHSDPERDQCSEYLSAVRTIDPSFARLSAQRRTQFFAFKIRPLQNGPSKSSDLSWQSQISQRSWIFRSVLARLAGHQEEIQAERDRKLEAARKQRQIRRQRVA
jgi:hypothetical protein